MKFLYKNAYAEKNRVWEAQCRCRLYDICMCTSQFAQINCMCIKISQNSSLLWEQVCIHESIGANCLSVRTGHYSWSRPCLFPTRYIYIVCQQFLTETCALDLSSVKNLQSNPYCYGCNTSQVQKPKIENYWPLKLLDISVATMSMNNYIV